MSADDWALFGLGLLQTLFGLCMGYIIWGVKGKHLGHRDTGDEHKPAREWKQASENLNPRIIPPLPPLDGAEIGAAEREELARQLAIKQMAYMREVMRNLDTGE